MVAHHHVPTAVVGHRALTVRAFDGFATIKAANFGGETASIQKNNGLFPGINGASQGGDELVGEDGSVVFDGGGLDCFEVDELDFRHGSVGDASGHFQQLEASSSGVLQGFEGGRGRAEHGDGLVAAGKDEGGVTGVVAHTFVLLEGAVVFLIDEDQAQIFDGGEEGGASSNNDTDLSTSNATPLGSTLRGCELRVHNGEVFVEGGAQYADELRGERDFRQQNHGASAVAPCFTDGSDVDFGFPGSGHAVQEQGLGFLFCQGVCDRFDGVCLVFGEYRVGLPSLDRCVPEGVKLHGHFFKADEVALLEASNGGAVCLVQFAEFGEPDFFVLLKKLEDEGLAFSKVSFDGVSGGSDDQVGAGFSFSAGVFEADGFGFFEGFEVVISERGEGGTQECVLAGSFGQVLKNFRCDTIKLLRVDIVVSHPDRGSLGWSEHAGHGQVNRFPDFRVVVGGDPFAELEEGFGQAALGVENVGNRAHSLNMRGFFFPLCHDHADFDLIPKGNKHPVSSLGLRLEGSGNGVGEQAFQRQVKGDVDEHEARGERWAKRRTSCVA